MPMYIVRPRMPYWDEDVERDVLMPETMVVVEDDDDVDTGLVDARGYAIYRTSERVSAGFRTGRKR